MSKIEIIPNFHPIFVHFTISLLSISTLLFIVAILLKNKSYINLIINTAYVNLWLGVIITIITIGMGFYAYYTVAYDSASHLEIEKHRNWALITFSFFIISFIWSIINFSKKSYYNIFFVIFLIISTGFLTITAYEGTELVYEYGIGVKSLPKINDDGGHDSHPDSVGNGHDH